MLQRVNYVTPHLKNVIEAVKVVLEQFKLAIVMLYTRTVYSLQILMFVKAI